MASPRLAAVTRTPVPIDLLRCPCQYVDPFCALHSDVCDTKRQLAGQSNIVGMLGFCHTTIVTEYHDSFLQVMFREGRQLPIANVLSMALDAARGVQVSVY